MMRTFSHGDTPCGLHYSQKTRSIDGMNSKDDQTKPLVPATKDDEETTVSNLPELAESAATPAAAPAPAVTKGVKSSVAGGTWIAMILGALLLIVLLIFIVQNQQPSVIHFFTWTLTVPTGAGYLFAAIIGALVLAPVGMVRIMQLRRQVKAAKKAFPQRPPKRID